MLPKTSKAARENNSDWDNMDMYYYWGHDKAPNISRPDGKDWEGQPLNHRNDIRKIRDKADKIMCHSGVYMCIPK
ncbi:hypothetical protein LX15_000950 [Streptoalloteichus tenebrarius]|uniref:Uncharacterized protein n=1 Tax=Streptoalloteichus tenebrarius (strain ATCC 17920 / DSM 40477 / JCM 4838 / CBS 697.72 / NBRC 16177 / NCIMB 11028 / NRRL B-12390 / A12253. 1 / ISP 5477) TaxID=1933 RepID=A0ABT1HP32_STRSD|nr:hypothetical protein [Streptoalloteichus tenebrarius]MCP2257265.1 hypothetical protein [Streptoalloteichus tenebrarius]BFF04172.1 hypothetical protein GCM10020241_58470 [Streptoalloteichus tenebrarius]